MNLYADKINSVVGISKILLFFSKSCLMSPKKKVFVVVESFRFEML